MERPALERCRSATYALEGLVAGYLEGITHQWLLVAPRANPAMLEMFRDRDRRPGRALVPWAGEFAGKYLTGATQVLRLTGDPRLRGHLEWFVRELVSLQAEDGYLGPWSRPYRLTNRGMNVGQRGVEESTWDTWGHYHVMLGLLLWHEETADARALQCVRRIADLLCDRYLGGRRPRLVDTGSTEMNLAPLHALCLLYRQDPNPRYLDLAGQILEEFGATDEQGRPLAGNYLEGPLAGLEFYQLPRPRWESLHPILGLAEYHRLTGDPRCRQAFERVWHSIVRLDRHNNGGFSSGEQAQGNPYHPGAIETCCTIAWAALSVEMLRLTGLSTVADELELTTLNSVVGMHSPTGRWAAYNTPMDGVRIASAQEIVFQSREGSPELNCCSANSARGFGMISDWALMEDSEGLVLNWYGPGQMRCAAPSGTPVTLVQETTYPRDGHVTLRVDPAESSAFTLKLRIPHWSSATRLEVNGRKVAEVPPGAYLPLRRDWQPGDRLELEMDFSPRFWVGERECEGKTSVYRGPLLLAYDQRFNDADPDDLPALDPRSLETAPVTWEGWLPPFLLLECRTADGRPLRLCDFGSAGDGGSPYRTWLKVRMKDERG